MKKVLFKLCLSVLFLALIGCSSPSSKGVEEIVESQDVSIEAEQAAPTSTQAPVATLPPPAVASATPLPPTATSIPPTIGPTLAPTATNDEVIPTVADDSGESTATDSNDVVFGRTPEGAFFYGSPSAEITLIDYSEFL